MQTKAFADLNVNTLAKRDEAARVTGSAPLELNLGDLAFVSGGGSPHGSWAASAVATVTVSSPHGSW